MSVAMATALWTTAIAVELNRELYIGARSKSFEVGCHVIVWSLSVAVGGFVASTDEDYHFIKFGCGNTHVANFVVLVILAPLIFCVNVVVSLAFWFKARQMYPHEAGAWLRNKAWRTSAVFVYIVAWSPSVASAVVRWSTNADLPATFPVDGQAAAMVVFALQGFFNFLSFIANQTSALGMDGGTPFDDDSFASASDNKSSNRSEQGHLKGRPSADSMPLKFINVSELDIHEGDGGVLGKGGHGVVRTATWKGQPVAVKSLHLVTTLSAQEVEVLKKEALLMAMLYHRNVVALYGIALTVVDTSEIDIHIKRCSNIMLVLELGELGSCMDVGEQLGFSRDHHFFFAESSAERYRYVNELSYSGRQSFAQSDYLSDGCEECWESSEERPSRRSALSCDAGSADSNDATSRGRPPAQKRLNLRFTQLKLKLVLGAGRGMRYLHRTNPPVAHNDLKPGNLFVQGDWTVKVGDFGLSKLVSGKLKEEGFRGTLLYSSANAIAGACSPLADDVWSFGMCVYHLFEGFAPFHGGMRMMPQATAGKSCANSAPKEWRCISASVTSTASETSISESEHRRFWLATQPSMQSSVDLEPGDAQELLLSSMSAVMQTPDSPCDGKSVRAAILDGWRPAFSEGTPSWVSELAEQCWQNDPAERPTMGEVVEALETHALAEGYSI
jgi:serine/threonine protein kinase